MAFYTIENDVFRRVFEVAPQGVRTVSMVDKRSELEYISQPVREFMFSIDDRMISSWMASTVRLVDGNVEQSGSAPAFIRAEESAGTLKLFFSVSEVEVIVTCTVYPGICGYRKHLTLTNTGNKKLKIDKLAFDDTCAAPGKFADCSLFSGAEEHRRMICFTSEAAEDIVRCHNNELDAGFFMGSTAPGIMRYMMIYPVWFNAMNALNMSSAPFACYLDPGESFQSPDSIFALYRAPLDSPDAADDFRALIRQKLPALPDSEGLMYCTWFPFLKNINTALIRQLSTEAADLGFRYFVLDDGWFTSGSREVDREKFPGGLEEVSQMIHSAGMIFGLWLNIGTDYGLENIDETWFAKQYDGQNSRLGFDYGASRNVLCLGSSYRKYILQTMIDLQKKYQIGYFKLDFSSIMSPYGLLPYGCHAKNHEHHHSWEDSFMAMYDGMKFIKDEMAKICPQVILDFSFEAFGTEKPNIAALELSALHHVSNISGENPDIQSFRLARESFYPFLEKLPPERILNGLIAIQGDRCAEALLTSFAGAPLAAGDLRTLSGQDKMRLKKFITAFNTAVKDGHLTEFRSFKPAKDVDGFRRFNKNGDGFAVYFNHSSQPFTVGTPENHRLINVESGNGMTIPPHGCAMFTMQAQKRK